jgi:hypothetical protein
MSTSAFPERGGYSSSIFLGLCVLHGLLFFHAHALPILFLLIFLFVFLFAQ